MRDFKNRNFMFRNVRNLNSLVTDKTPETVEMIADQEDFLNQEGNVAPILVNYPGVGIVAIEIKTSGNENV